MALGAIIAGGLALAGGRSLLSGANSALGNFQQFNYDTALKQQQFQYDTQLAQQKFGYDTALSAQNAQQELAKQINQQQYEKMMSDTEMQRKIADYQQAGVNPALAFGGVSNTEQASSAQQAQSSAPQDKAPTQKTNARQQIEADTKLVLASALRNAVLKEATKKIDTLGQALAKQPKNKSLKNKLQRYVYETISILK